jgi:hypothetical protein
MRKLGDTNAAGEVGLVTTRLALEPINVSPELSIIKPPNSRSMVASGEHWFLLTSINVRNSPNKRLLFFFTSARLTSTRAGSIA